jgi:hypothetical protein
MKKIIMALALIASIQIAGAQQQAKSLSAAKSAVESAQKTAEHPKKATNPTTWIKLGQAWMDAYVAPMGNGWTGATEQELNLLMSQYKVLGTSQETIQGQTYMVKRYQTADYYFNTDGRLAAIKVTKPIAKNCLEEALNAYKKAHEVDAKAKKTKDIVNGIQNVNARYIEEAYTAYTLGNMKDASKFFEYAAKAAAVAPNSQIDTNSIYNAGLTAWFLANEKGGWLRLRLH